MDTKICFRILITHTKPPYTTLQHHGLAICSSSSPSSSPSSLPTSTSSPVSVFYFIYQTVVPASCDPATGFRPLHLGCAFDWREAASSSIPMCSVRSYRPSSGSVSFFRCFSCLRSARLFSSARGLALFKPILHRVIKILLWILIADPRSRPHLLRLFCSWGRRSGIFSCCRISNRSFLLDWRRFFFDSLFCLVCL